MNSRRLAALLIATTAVLAGCGSNGFHAPATFRASDRSVRTLVIAATKGNELSPGLATPPYVKCEPAECYILMTIKEPLGLNFDDEEIQPTRQIWKALFEDSRIESSIITVQAPATTAGGKSTTAPAYSMRCTREDASQIEWDGPEEGNLKKVCEYVEHEYEPARWIPKKDTQAAKPKPSTTAKARVSAECRHIVETENLHECEDTTSSPLEACQGEGGDKYCPQATPAEEDAQRADEERAEHPAVSVRESRACREERSEHEYEEAAENYTPLKARCR